MQNADTTRAATPLEQELAAAIDALRDAHTLPTSHPEYDTRVLEAWRNANRAAAKVPTDDHTEIVRFQVGQTYYDRSIGDHDCIYRFEIVRRTVRSIWFRSPGGDEVQRRALSVYNGVEKFSPYGRYSMASTAYADRLASDLAD